MFALIAAILAGVAFVLSLVDSAVPGWMLWAVLFNMALHMLVGVWPFGAIVVNRRPGS